MDSFPVWLSLRVALSATALTLLTGVPTAWLLARKRFPGRNALEAVVVLPLVLPPTVLGYYLLVVIGYRGPIGRALAAIGLELAFTPAAAVLAACVGSIALVIKSAQAGFETVDRQLEQAARTLGRSECSGASRSRSRGARCSPERFWRSAGRSASSGSPSWWPGTFRDGPRHCRWRSTIESKPIRWAKRTRSPWSRSASSSCCCSA